MSCKKTRSLPVILLLCAASAMAMDVSSSTVPSAAEVGTSSTTAAPLRWRSVSQAAFRAPEHLLFVVKWGVVTAGYSTLDIVGLESVDGRPTYHIVSKARSGGVVSAFYRVEDENQSWLDQESLVSVRFEKRIKEGKYRIEESTLIDQQTHRFHLQSYRLDKNLYEQKDGEVPPNVMDVLGSLYYVRVLPLVVGDSFTMDVLSGDKVYPLVVHVKKKERIKVPAGRFDTILVQPLLRGPGIFIAKGKKLEVWLTDDERHIPVRMRSEVFIGHVSAELLPSDAKDRF